MDSVDDIRGDRQRPDAMAALYKALPRPTVLPKGHRRVKGADKDAKALKQMALEMQETSAAAMPAAPGKTGGIIDTTSSGKATTKAIFDNEDDADDSNDDSNIAVAPKTGGKKSAAASAAPREQTTTGRKSRNGEARGRCELSNWT